MTTQKGKAMEQRSTLTKTDRYSLVIEAFSLWLSFVALPYPVSKGRRIKYNRIEDKLYTRFSRRIELYRGDK